MEELEKVKKDGQHYNPSASSSGVSNFTNMNFNQDQ